VLNNKSTKYINMYTHKVNVLLNKSESRSSRELSCFSKSFFDELYDKFKSDGYFWDHQWFNLYTRNYEEFVQKIKEKYNFTLQTNDVPTILIDNWRYNKKLIDYIITEKKQNYYLNAEINGDNDRLYIAYVDSDDFESHEICYGYGGQEILQSIINYKEIIQDLQKMILPHYRNGDDLEDYFRLNKVNKYTYMCFKKYIDFNEDYMDYWEKYSGKYYKEILEVDLEADFY